MANPKASTAKGKGKAVETQAAPGEIVLGSMVIFAGYPEDTDPAEMVLEADGEYEVVGLPEAVTIDGVEEMSGFILRLANPAFNAKKKEHPDTNPAFLETEVFEEEITLADDNVVATVPAGKGAAADPEAEGNDEGGEGDEPIDLAYLRTLTKEDLIELAKAEDVKLTPAQKKTAETIVAHLAKVWELEEVEEEPPVPETPAPTTRGKAAAKPAAEAAATTGKGKGAAATAKPAATTKPAAAPKTPTPPADPVDPDEVPDLDPASEEEGVLALIANEADLIAVAQDLESEVATNEYRLGGILYHIKKNKLHLATDKKGNLIEPEYGLPGGFKKFLMDNFNVEYRKATHLIDIYVNFTQAGIENAAEVVGNIGWTKASKIAKPIGMEDADVDGLLDAAEKNTVVDLSAIIKEQFTVGGTPGTPGTAGTTLNRTTLRFRYVEEEAAVIEDALKALADNFGINPEAALFQAVTDAHARMVSGDAEPAETETETPPAATGRRGGRATARA